MKILQDLKGLFDWLSDEVNKHTPLNDMCKDDVLDLIKDYEKSRTINTNDKLENVISRGFRNTKRFLKFIVFIFVSFAAIYSFDDMYAVYEEHVERTEAIENLNNVAKTMYYRENSPLLALDLINQSLELDDKNSQTLYLRSFIQSMISVEVLLNLDRPRNADELLQAQTALANSEFLLESENEDFYSHAYLIQSQVYLALKEYDKAKLAINRAIEYDREKSFYKIRKASILSETREYDEALKLLNSIHSADAYDQKWVSLWKGLIYQKLSINLKNDRVKNAQESFKYFDDAYKLDTKFHLAIINLGIEYIVQGNSDQAIEMFEMALELRPSSKKVYYLLGNAYGSKDEYEKAQNYLLQALKIDEDYFSANLLLGDVFYEMHLYEKALQQYEKAGKLNPKDIEVYYRRGLVYYKLSKDIEAVQDFLYVLESGDEFNYEAYLALVDVYLKYNDRVNAQRVLEKAKLQYKDEDYYIAMFELYNKFGESIKAITSINTAIEMAGDNKRKHYKLKIHYLYEQKQYAQVLETLKEMKQLKGTIRFDEKVSILEYKTLKELGMNQEAQEVLYKIKSINPRFLE